MGPFLRNYKIFGFKAPFLLLPSSICMLLCRTLRRPGQFTEKVNRGMILAPLAGIVLNLLDASRERDCGERNDIVAVFASMDCADTILCGFQYLIEYDWVRINFLMFLVLFKVLDV